MSKYKLLLAVACLAVVGYFVFQEKINAFEFSSIESEELENDPIVEVRQRREDGVLKADAEFIDGKRNGVANNYYANGSIHSKIIYKEDIKHGDAVWFYRDGKPYRVTPFVNGKKDGIQTKFYKDGTLMAEIPYFAGELITGTKEYWETGKLKTECPNVIIGHSKKNVLLVSLQPYVKKAKYHATVLNKSKSIKVAGVESNREAVLDLSGYSGEAKIYVSYKTKMGNEKLVEKTVQL